MMDEQKVPHADGDCDECKIFVSRIPKQFDESSVKRLLEDRLELGAVVDVSLVVKNDEDGPVHHEKGVMSRGQVQKHRGFAFVTLKNADLQKRAIQLGTARGGVKATSTKKFTIYVRAVVRDDIQESSGKQICFLWNNFRCPYGDECKFLHEGDGGSLEKNKDSKSKKKCFAFKKGKCKVGDQCPHSHDFEVAKNSALKVEIPAEKKDCINWKTKGRCRKGDACPYRHDEEILKSFLTKKRRKLDEEESIAEKTPQPLCVRVFGLNYDTTEEDVLGFFRTCGKITEVSFPKFEDSGRSKGYCGIVFQSPKAVAAAVALDGQELHGRWLQIQAGKMYLKQWEERHEKGRADPATRDVEPPRSDDKLVGEFGQKVKRRKKHGYKE